MSKMWERADFWVADDPDAPPSDDYARGVAEGRRAVESEVASERAALLQLADGLEALTAPAPGLLAAMMMTAIERLVVDIAGNAPVDRDLLHERADALATFMAGDAEAVLVVHPEDIVLFEGGNVIADSAVPRGTVQARLGDAIVEDGVASALARLRTQIDAMGLST